MLYCESCRVERSWPVSLTKSVGICEICGEPAVCYDVPSSQLAMPRDEDAILEALKVIGALRENGFKIISDSKTETVLEKDNIRVSVQITKGEGKKV